MTFRLSVWTCTFITGIKDVLDNLVVHFNYSAAHRELLSRFEEIIISSLSSLFVFCFGVHYRACSSSRSDARPVIAQQTVSEVMCYLTIHSFRMELKV